MNGRLIERFVSSSGSPGYKYNFKKINEVFKSKRHIYNDLKTKRLAQLEHGNRGKRPRNAAETPRI